MGETGSQLLTGEGEPLEGDPALVSIVIPAFNEEGNIERVEREVLASIEGLPYRFEFILVDNASDDATGELAKRICARDPRWKYIRFSRTFDLEMSITAGYEYANGDAIIVVYSDLQEPPEKIPEFIEKWEQGYDVVYGVHVRRHGERAFRTWSGKLGYRLISRLAEVRIPPDVCDFRLITREVRNTLMQFGERLRYLRGLIAWLGFRQVGVPYERQAREAGRSKANVSLLFKYLLNGIFGFSLKPLRLFAILGSVLLAVAAIWALVAAGSAIGGTAPSEASLLAILIIAVAGFNSLGIWMVGEYVGRAYIETLRRPLFIVAETMNVEPPRQPTPPPAHVAVR
jgi:glycosyltransferase involved in cell wall biosynthesis